MDDEMIDVFTSEGRPTGLRKAKSAVHRDGDWHISVHIWILTPRNQLLLQRRADVKENYPGLWDVSVAGHISAGETAIEAALREASEEIGIDLGNDRFDSVARIAEEVVLRAIDPTALVLQAEEVAAVRLVGVQELARMAASRDRSLVPHWREYEVLIARLSGPVIPS